ncbi:MAG: hypothetical protein IJ774_02985 [Selenomonadaceae bacterium]|nr:hypothetical protein [Selenomonadaceae bacterium]
MLNVNDPIIKRFMENLHNSVERRIRRQTSGADFGNDYVLENRLLKIFCEDKLIEPHRCAEQLNRRYNYNLNGEGVIQILRFLHLTYQTRRAELFDWATETVDAFTKALEFRTAKDFDAFIALRDKGVSDRNGEQFRIQARVVCLMLYVKHPELCTENDNELIEKFGNVHMKYFFYEVADFLRNICIDNRRNVDKKNLLSTMSLKDFLSLVYAEYPALAVDESLLEQLDSISVMQFFNESTRNADSFSSMTVEEFLLNDPDADSLLIPVSVADSVSAD